MQNIDFNNTQIAFEYRSDRALKKAHFLFSLLTYPWLVNLGSPVILALRKVRLAPLWLLKPMMFSHFCGGVNLEETAAVAEKLNKYNVKSIPDFSVEGKTTNSGIDAVVEEILLSIVAAFKNKNFAFSVFKPTGLAPADLLEKMSNNQSLTTEEEEMAKQFHHRFERICKTASDYQVRLLIDAEEFCFQNLIDAKTEEMMKLYNKDKVLVYNTVQMYRHDREVYVNELIERAKSVGFFVGLKVVRGAYLEKENLRAKQGGYPTPIYGSKEETDAAYDRVAKVIVNNIDRCELFLGTHNLKSVEELMMLMEQKGIAKNDPRIVISQLFGMSDHLSFNLAKANYNVVKYLPYGPIHEIIPYLIRRAQENTSVAGQTGRELALIKQELNRRNKTKS